MNWTRLGVVQVLIGLVLASLYFSPALSNLFEFVAVILVATSTALRRRVRDFLLSPVANWYGLFLLVLALGAVIGMLQGNSSLSEMWGWRKVLLLPLGAAMFMGEELAKHRLALGFLAVSLVFALWSNLNFLIGLNPVVTKNYAVQGIFFTVAVIFCLEFYSLASSAKEKFVFVMAAALLTFSVFFLTSGRSGYLAWLISTPIASFLIIRNRAWAKAAISLIVLTVGLTLVFYSNIGKNSIFKGITEIQSVKSQEHETRMGDRVLMWNKTLKMVPEYALFGAGLAGFGKAFERSWRPDNAVDWKELSDPHNQYLKIIIELGAPGLLVFILFLTKVVANSLRGNRLQRLSVGVLIAWCATSFFSAHFTTFHEGHFIWIFIGVFLSHRTPNRLAS